MPKFRLKGKKGGEKGAGMPRLFGGAGAMAHFDCSKSEDTFYCNLSKIYSIIMMLLGILIVCLVLYNIYLIFKSGGFRWGKRGGGRKK